MSPRVQAERHSSSDLQSITIKIILFRMQFFLLSIIITFSLHLSLSVSLFLSFNFMHFSFSAISHCVCSVFNEILESEQGQVGRVINVAHRGLMHSEAMVGIFTVQKQAQSPSKQVEFLPVDAAVLHLAKVLSHS